MKHLLRLTALALLSIAPAEAQELAGTFDYASSSHPATPS